MDVDEGVGANLAGADVEVEDNVEDDDLEDGCFLAAILRSSGPRNTRMPLLYSSRFSRARVCVCVFIIIDVVVVVVVDSFIVAEEG